MEKRGRVIIVINPDEEACFCEDCGQLFAPIKTGETFCGGTVCRWWVIDQAAFDNREEEEEEEEDGNWWNAHAEVVK